MALKQPLAGPLTLLAAVLLVTTLTAEDWRLALWGSYPRSQGALALLTYVLLCALAAAQFGNLSRAKTVIAAMAATAAPIVMLGTAQFLGWNPLDLVSDARSPIYATLGRSNFVGAYLALLTPLTAAMLFASEGRGGRALWSALLAGQLVLIGFTLSRSAWLATAVALLLFVLLWQWPRLTRTARWVGMCIVGALAFSGPVAVLVLGSHTLGSIAARATIWQATARLIAERPLLGFGADALGMTFGRVFPPQLVYLQGRDVFVDRAHNLFLDWTLATGAPGLLAYLLVLAAFAFAVGRALLRPDAPTLSTQRRVLLAAILAAVAGNVTNTLVSFDVTPTATATWLLIGMGVALVAPIIQPRTERSVVAFGRRSVAMTGVLLAVTLLAAWQFNGRPLMADVAARTAQRHMLRGEWEQAAAQAQRAVAYWSVEPAHHLLAGAAFARLAAVEPERASEASAQAERAFAKATALRPGDAHGWLIAADYYVASACTMMPARLSVHWMRMAVRWIWPRTTPRSTRPWAHSTGSRTTQCVRRRRCAAPLRWTPRTQRRICIWRRRSWPSAASR